MRKTHLVNWSTVCLDKDKRGLGFRNQDLLNKASLGKWVWSFTVGEDATWKTSIKAK